MEGSTTTQDEIHHEEKDRSESSEEGQTDLKERGLKLLLLNKVYFSFRNYVCFWFTLAKTNQQGFYLVYGHAPW